jgi:Na+/H+ antiporter NhaD/arsenite permease-like protein
VRDWDPIPFVLSEVLAANVDRIATMVGDPTNVIIGSSPLVNLSFNQFLANTAPIALAILGVNSSILYLRNFRDLLVNSRVFPVVFETKAFSTPTSTRSIS